MNIHDSKAHTAALGGIAAIVVCLLVVLFGSSTADAACTKSALTTSINNAFPTTGIGVISAFSTRTNLVADFNCTATLDDPNTFSQPQTFSTGALTSGISIFGDTAGASWVNAQLPGSAGQTPFSAIATTGANYSAGLFATKTSLNNSVGQSLIGATFLNYADNTTVGNLALTWAYYAETVVAPSSTFLQAFGGEVSSANQKANSGFEDPYTPNPAALVVGTRFSAGIGSAAFNASAAIDIVPNGAKYWSGIVIDPAALDTTSGYADAYATGVNSGVSFYSAASTRAVKFFLNDATAVVNAEQVIFGNNVLDVFINGGAYHALAITSTAVGIGGGSGITTSGPGGALTALAYTIPATGIATFLATPTSANLAAALTDETGTGKAVFGTSPTLTTPALSGSSTGLQSLASANAGASNFTATFPAATDTVAELTQTQTLTNKTIAFASNTLTGVAPLASPTFTGTVTMPVGTWDSSNLNLLTNALQIGSITTLSRNSGTGALTINSNASTIALTPAGVSNFVFGATSLNVAAAVVGGTATKFICSDASNNWFAQVAAC